MAIFLPDLGGSNKLFLHQLMAGRVMDVPVAVKQKSVASVSSDHGEIS